MWACRHSTIHRPRVLQQQQAIDRRLFRWAISLCWELRVHVAMRDNSSAFFLQLASLLETSQVAPASCLWNQFYFQPNPQSPLRKLFQSHTLLHELNRSLSARGTETFFVREFTSLCLVHLCLKLVLARTAGCFDLSFHIKQFFVFPSLKHQLHPSSSTVTTSFIKLSFQALAFSACEA